MSTVITFLWLALKVRVKIASTRMLTGATITPVTPSIKGSMSMLVWCNCREWISGMDISIVQGVLIACCASTRTKTVETPNRPRSCVFTSPPCTPKPPHNSSGEYEGTTIQVNLSSHRPSASSTTGPVKCFFPPRR